MFQRQQSFPCTTTSYYAYSLAAIAMRAVAAVPQAAETYAVPRRRVTTSPLGGLPFAARDRNSGQWLAYPAWDIVLP